MTAAEPRSSTNFCHSRKQSMYGRLDWSHLYAVGMNTTIATHPPILSANQIIDGTLLRIHHGPIRSHATFWGNFLTKSSKHVSVAQPFAMSCHFVCACGILLLLLLLLLSQLAGHFVTSLGGDFGHAHAYFVVAKQPFLHTRSRCCASVLFPLFHFSFGLLLQRIRVNGKVDRRARVGRWKRLLL